MGRGKFNPDKYYEILKIFKQRKKKKNCTTLRSYVGVDKVNNDLAYEVFILGGLIDKYFTDQFPPTPNKDWYSKDYKFSNQIHSDVHVIYKGDVYNS